MDIKDTLNGMGVPKYMTAFFEKYFQLEVINNDKLPKAGEENVMYVMNHTAFFALEVYLIGMYLHAKDPSIDMKTLVWKGFSEGPAGLWFRTLGAETASISKGAELLKAGTSVMIMPEGVDATDVRNKFNVFHTGFLRMLREHPVRIVPIGFTGVDESIPWWVTENKFLAEKLMQGVNPDFNFAMFPKLPVMRPTKIVFNIGEPISFSAADLESEEQIKTARDQVRESIVGLVEEAELHRAKTIGKSRINSLFHKVVAGKISRLPF